MTPFNPSALVAMLLAFYPIVNGSELARARRERPEYFAGGTLGGSHGDKLVLPDARCWDCIYGSGTNDPAVMRWQCIPCGDGAGGDPLFPLEPGPLTPIDETQWPAPAPSDVFLPLVGDALAELGASAALLDAAASTFAEGASPAAFDGAVSGAIDEADEARLQQAGPLEQATPGDLLEATHDRGGAIDGGEADAEFEPPPYTSPEPPGPAPSQSDPGPGDPYTDPSGVDRHR